ncbi:MAG: c-type cytochrome biogenesis protein CcmI [Methylococcales bacterium]|nr:c-type cytochrome biogenesis protein CcmI [Methylococcaceae bacterium]
MFQFWIFAALLLLVALCVILIPLWTARSLPKSNEDRTNVLLAQKKLRELDDDLAAGNLTQEQYALAKEELEVSLYHDLQADVLLSVDENKGRWLAIPLVLFVPLIALALYSIIGDKRAFDSNAQTQVQNTQADPGKAAEISTMVDKLAKRLEKEPNDAKGWKMLGHSYKVLQRYPEAVAALRKAYALLGDEADVLLELADAIAMEKGGSLKGEATELVTKAIKLAPDNEMALWLFGMAKAGEGNYAEALNAWTKLQAHYQPGEQAYQEAQQLIDLANERSGKAPVAAQQGQKPVDASKPEPQKNAKVSGSVTVKVELSEAFKAKVKPDDYVFIYAQAITGPKAPLAVVKHQVKELPIQVILDDSMAMIPSMTVSSVENIKVTARVSAAGTATPEPGEPIGSIELKGADRVGVKSIVIADTVK